MYHGAAVGLIHGRAGEEEFSDAVVNDSRVVALRARVHATADDAIHEAAVLATAVLADGRRIQVRVDHAIGSLERPLSDAQLEAKFHALVAPRLGEAKARDITTACWRLATAADVRELVAKCRP